MISARAKTNSQASPDEIEAEGNDLIARGHMKLAEAARLRASKAFSTASDFVRVDDLPLPKRTARAAAKSGAIIGAVKKGRNWIAPRTSANAFLAAAQKPDAAVAASNDAGDEDEIRTSLGLAPRRSA